MQNTFSKRKRKQSSDEADSESRNVKQKKYDTKRAGGDLTHSPNNGEVHSESKRVFEKAHNTRKIASLIKALDEVLDESSVDDTVNLIGDEALGRCLDLQSTLSRSRAKIDISNIPSLPATVSSDFANFPNLVSTTSITPWKSSTIPTSLPKLPTNLDTTLEMSAFTHRGIGHGTVTDLNYERLEWVGDAYIELISTLLVAQTFPYLSPGKASQMRERLVKNITLAEFARKYGFDKRVRLPDVLQARSRDEMTKIMGDVFEAYVAAVILSDPVGGVSTASAWLKDLWSMTIARDIIDEERSMLKIDSPMWRLRGDSKPAQDAFNGSIPLHAKDELQKLIGCKGVKLRYKDAAPERKDPTNKLPLFTVGVYLEGWGETNKLLGSGKANGKKDAGTKAAQMALDNKRLLAIYAAKKRAYEAQMGLEKEALASHNQK